MHDTISLIQHDELNLHDGISYNIQHNKLNLKDDIMLIQHKKLNIHDDLSYI